MRFLRCLRDLEKWSWIGKMGKNEENGVKKTAPESPIIHYWENLPNLPVPSHKALAYQILLVALSSGPLPKVPKS